MSEESVPPISNIGFARWLWRQLTSMRTALILLFLLAIASIPGSLFPQRTVDAVKVRNYITANPTTGPVLDRFGFFDVYGSPWFAAVYLLLFVSLIGCVLPRIAQHWRAMRTPPPVAPRNLSRLPDARAFATDDPSVAVSRARKYFKKHHWRIREGDDWIAAEKGYLRETGNLVFHLSLVVLLIAIAVGALWGWKGNVIVRQGTGFSDTVTQYDAWGGGRFADSSKVRPFAFTLDQFDVEFERGNTQMGAPREFNASITVTPSPGAPSYPDTVEVNHPLSIDGVKAFLVGHGYAPRFIVKAPDGTVIFDDTVAFLPQDGNFTSSGVVKLPDVSPNLGIQGLFLPTAAVDMTMGPHSTFPAPDDPKVYMSVWAGDLGLNNGVPQSVYKLDTSNMKRVALEELGPGETLTLEDGTTITFADFTRYASFQIAYDPGTTLALSAAVLAIIGLLASLFIKRRRAWVRVSGDGPGATVEVAGLAKTDSGDLPDEVERLAQYVEHGTEPTE